MSCRTSLKSSCLSPDGPEAAEEDQEQREEGEAAAAPEENGRMMRRAGGAAPEEEDPPVCVCACRRTRSEPRRTASSRGSVTFSSGSSRGSEQMVALHPSS